MATFWNNRVFCPFSWQTALREQRSCTCTHPAGVSTHTSVAMADSAYSPKTQRNPLACKRTHTHTHTFKPWMCVSKTSPPTSQHVGSCSLQECAYTSPPRPHPPSLRPAAARPPSRGSAASPLVITATLCPSWSSWWPSSWAWARCSVAWPSSSTASSEGGECQEQGQEGGRSPSRDADKPSPWMDAHVNDGDILKVNDLPPHRCVKPAPLIKSTSDSSVWTFTIIFIFNLSLTYSVFCLFIVFSFNKKIELQPQSHLSFCV